MVLPEVTTLAEARNAIRDLAEENEKLSNELAWFRRQLFGSKTEHYIPRDDTPSLFPEEMSPESPKEVPTATVAEHERKVRQANALSEIPADLPREERVIDVPEEEREGMILIGYDESERIAYQTGLYVIHFKRAKYADPSRAADAEHDCLLSRFNTSDSVVPSKPFATAISMPSISSRIPELSLALVGKGLTSTSSSDSASLASSRRALINNITWTIQQTIQYCNTLYLSVSSNLF